MKKKINIKRTLIISLSFGGILYLLVHSQIAAIEISQAVTEILEPNESNNEMIAYVESWARLEKIPEEKTNFKITPSGSSFTRTYKGSFELPKEILEKWIEESPGLQDAEKEEVQPQVFKYKIKPNRAILAEIIIDFEKGLVNFHAIWS